MIVVTASHGNRGARDHHYAELADYPNSRRGMHDGKLLLMRLSHSWRLKQFSLPQNAVVDSFWRRSVTSTRSIQKPHWSWLSTTSKPKVRNPEGIGCHAIHAAARRGLLGMITTLVHDHEVDPDQTDDNGATPILYALLLPIEQAHICVGSVLELNLTILSGS